MSVEPIRVAIVDDQLLVRHGFKYIINAQPDMEVVGQASNGREAVTLADLARPHVLLMDVQMPEYSGIEATRDIMAAWPDCKIIILTTFDTEEYVFQGIRSGAIGYLLKDTSPEELIEAIRAASRGEAIFRTAIASKAMSRVVRSARVNTADIDLGNSTGEPITEREHEVLQQMAFGLRNEEIAAKLYIGESTVKTHVHHILRKLGVDDRTQAVVFAIRNRIVQ
ncbi:response regulator [Paenibacillus sacheonensis]|uniref:Response regulator n=1 Tax=Paenibacillus sacheonensis TaxID=742054 RepID=A0A7X5BVW5_9BACL|nr:response regulator transcription factor [Paenibacillus sacheonensis]MBM7565891.1 DNA-binding NarL/FixJ family response regulator [Paenibacillus sacheonensis]NBC68793.1 response regulator [Paenibacillus sacheonensis]